MILRYSAFSLAAIFCASHTALAWTPDKSPGCEKPANMSSAFSRCETKPTSGLPATNDNAYCLPNAEGTGTLPTNFSVEKKNGNTSATLTIAVKNCRTPTGNIKGDFVVAVDNSSSDCKATDATGSDCAGRRLNFAKNIATELRANGSNSVKIVSYGGRQSTVFSPPTYSNDAEYKIDPDVAKNACTDYASRTSDPWAADSNGALTSVCEIFTNTTATLQDAFIDSTGATPRGSTDFTYFLEAIQRPTMLGSSTSTSKHAIIITDGLPNIPRRIPRAVCEKSPILMSTITETGGAFFKETTGEQREYCFDRQIRAAINETNNYTNGTIDFSGAASQEPSRFSSINVHNILFLSSGLAYSEVDYGTNERLYPDDVLVENSARTGNGKVKFLYIIGGETDINSKETTFLQNLKEATDAHALQRVEVILGDVTYQAVSSDKFEEKFDIKIPALTASTAATLNFYYADSASSVPKTQTISITVTSPSVYSSNLCSDINSNLTIDGESPTLLNPAGDGMLPYLGNTNSVCRVFRNHSDYSQNTMNFYQQRYTETTRETAARLRIQGGTGNCGVVANASKISSILQLLALIPAFFFALGSRRRNS